MIHMSRIHQTMHRSIDRRLGGASAAVQAIIERGHHLILTLHPRIDVHQRPQPIQPQHRQPGLGQRPEITTRTLHPQQLNGPTSHRIDVHTLDRRVPAREIRITPIRPKPVRPV